MGAGWTGVGVNELGPPGLISFCVGETAGGVVVVGVVVLVVVGVVVEGFSSPLPPHAAVSPPIATRALVPTTAARQRTLRDLMMFPIYPRPAALRGHEPLGTACGSPEFRRSVCRLHLHVTGESALCQAILLSRTMPRPVGWFASPSSAPTGWVTPIKPTRARRGARRESRPSSDRAPRACTVPRDGLGWPAIAPGRVR